MRNETNHITLYRKKGNTTVEEVRFSIRYVAQKADEDHPTIGEHPPTIVTNLDGVTETSNRNFTLTVKATAYTGSPLYASQIEVQMDGKRITGPTGGPVYEYQLCFPDPIVGDTVEHTITIRARDGRATPPSCPIAFSTASWIPATSSARPISSSMPPPWDWM